MSGNNNSWFHCGRCGSLFQSVIGDIEDRLCTECGRNPSIGFETPPAMVPANLTENSGQESDHAGERERHSLRKRRKSHLMLKLLIGWSVVLGAIIFGARWMFHDGSQPVKLTTVVSPAASGPSEDELTFLNETGPLCNTVFSGFLTAGTPETRNQYVLTPVATASRMARFYGLNPIANIDPASLQLAKGAVLDLPGGRALETLWKTSDDRQFDAVFIQEGGEWRLDWDHFVRFSDYPWPLFLAGSGEPEGEFRLLARERLAEERKNADTISIVLYSPRFGSVNETGLQSPEFLIKRDSDDGRLLDAAFKLERKGERVYGVKINHPNPEGLIRVRVKVRRIEENKERRFELSKVVACHWYSVNDPGVKPAELTEKK